jgi:hypothetical protein
MTLPAFTDLQGEFPLALGGSLRDVRIRWEEWGRPRGDGSNTIMVFPALSAHSHLRSHPQDPTEGWWEDMVGPGRAFDTDRWHVLCASLVGSPYGSTSPLSTDPRTGRPYGPTFPPITPRDLAQGHKRLLDALALPQALHLEFLVRHNQVVRPVPGGLNPYHLGLRMWEDIERCGDDPTGEERERLPPGKTGRDLLFETREVDRDASFIRRWLQEPLMRELDLIRVEPRGEDLVISDVSDEQGWRAVKELLLKSVGMGSVPVIQVEDADLGGSRTLLLSHAHDGRDLQLENAERTLAYVHRLWGRDVILETLINGKPATLTYGEKGFTAKAAK